ncbi:MAG: ParA family protein [Nitrososphaeraceae archaeon]
MTRCITFHSYKGGTGKTTIAANLAAILAKAGNRVALLDLDVYAPSFSSYFEHHKPKYWINDFLEGKISVNEVLVNFTDVIGNIEGKLFVGFSNYHKEDVYKLDSSINQTNSSKLNFLKNFILLREEIISKRDIDYIIIDTSPGVRFWSINALAISDTILLTLKSGELDFDGTKNMCEEIYWSFSKFGTTSYLLLNKVAGYCSPPLIVEDKDKNNNKQLLNNRMKPNSSLNNLSKELKMNIISEIPCYCDIQFSHKEYLTALKFPDHQFSKKIIQISNNL